MFIAVIPNRNSTPTILLRESYREGSKVKSRTLANLTNWQPARIEAMRRALKGEFDGITDKIEPVVDQVFGPLFALKQMADRLAITGALGKSEMGKLALFLVLARVAHQGSRLSAVRWAREQAVEQTIGVSEFDENDLYQTLDWLANNQSKIEEKLYRNYIKRTGKPIALVFYDVTSSYLEGHQNELSEFGYNRDGKRGKRQIVIGLLTTQTGEPLAIRVFRGNTADPVTVSQQLAILKQEFGISEVILVGDRGMIKTKGKAHLADAHYRYITALTDRQVEKLIREKVIDPVLFDKTVCEIEHGQLRLILRRSEATARKETQRREDKLSKLANLIERRNSFTIKSKHANLEAGLRRLNKWLVRHRLTSFLRLIITDRRLVLNIDEQAKAKAALLDGCYVLETDVSKQLLDAQIIDARYRDLQQVEQDFRTLKTCLLEIRPLFVRKSSRTRGHVFVAMLALKIVREMHSLLHKAFGTTNDDPLAITLEDALSSLSRLCFYHYQIKDTELVRLPKPDQRQADIFHALAINFPA